MKNKYIFVLCLLLAILLVSFGLTNIYVSQNQTAKEDEFVVVTSFYPMYIATLNVVGETEGVTLKNLSEPQTGCLHDFQLTPEDMKLLSTADVFVINGGGAEGFIEDVAKQYPDLQLVCATEGLDLFHEEGHDEAVDHVHEYSLNPHAWMSVALYRQEVKNIVEGLAKLDPERALLYEGNGNAYDTKLASLQEKQDALLQKTEGVEAILLHCAFDYVALDYHMHTALCMDLDDERQVSAGEVAQVLDTIKTHGIGYILAEELYAASMCDLIQKEADVKVIYLDPLNRGVYETDSYIKAMEQNIKMLEDAFSVTLEE